MKKKVIVINQDDVKDCGPCCILSIVRYYGGYVPIEKIREDTYENHEGTSVYHLVNTLVNYGFDAVAKKYPDNTLPDLLPAIVHVHYENGLDHFLVLYEINNDKLIIMDPAKGKITLSKKLKSDIPAYKTLTDSQLFNQSFINENLPQPA